MTSGVARATLMVGLAVAAVSASGCSTKAPQQTSVMRQVGDLGFTARELRIHTFHYASFFASVVEIAADSIMRATDDPEIVMRALVWKTNAIPAIQVAVFNLDPFVGYLDAVILTRLQYEYFDSGFGGHRFGELQPIARQAATLLTARIDSTLISLKSRGLNLGEKEQFIYDWIDANPLNNDLFAVRSTTDVLAVIMAEDQVQGLSAVGGIAEQIDDLTYMLKTYGDVMPRLARWEAQKLLLEYGDEIALDSTMGSARQFMDSFPEFFETEMDTAFVRLHGESVALMAFIDRQRMAAMADVAALADEKLSDAMDELARIAAEERTALMAEMDSIAAASVDRLVDRLDRTVNYFMWKLAQLLAGAIAAIGLVWFLITRFVRSRGQEGTGADV